MGKVLGLVALGGVVGLVGLGVFVLGEDSGDGGAVAPREARARESGAREVERLTSQGGAPAGGRELVGPAGGTVDPAERVGELVAKLRVALDSDPVDVLVMDASLQELVALGTPEAADAFAELIGVESSYWGWRSALAGAFGMGSLDSPRVRDAAWSVLCEDAEAEGWSHPSGDLLSIMCRFGSERDARRLLELSERSPAALAAAVPEVRWLRDHSTGGEWLQLLEDGGLSSCAQLAGGLAAWHEAGVDERLWQFASDGESRAAQDVLGALAAEALPADGGDLLARFDGLGDPGRMAVYAGLAGNAALLTGSSGAWAERLMESITGPSPELAREAARLFAARFDRLISAELAARLSALRDGGSLPSELVSSLVHYERQHGR